MTTEYEVRLGKIELNGSLRHGGKAGLMGSISVKDRYVPEDFRGWACVVRDLGRTEEVLLMARAGVGRSCELSRQMGDGVNLHLKYVAPSVAEAIMTAERQGDLKTLKTLMIIEKGGLWGAIVGWLTRL